jgi:hypothetical protein
MNRLGTNHKNPWRSPSAVSLGLGGARQHNHQPKIDFRNTRVEAPKTSLPPQTRVEANWLNHRLTNLLLCSGLRGGFLRSGLRSSLLRGSFRSSLDGWLLCDSFLRSGLRGSLLRGGFRSSLDGWLRGGLLRGSFRGGLRSGLLCSSFRGWLCSGLLRSGLRGRFLGGRWSSSQNTHLPSKVVSVTGEKSEKKTTRTKS